MSSPTQPHGISRFSAGSATHPLRWLLRAVLALPVLLLGWQVMGPRGVHVEVLEQRWQRDIEVERLLLESGSAWCDELPAGAQDISRRWLEDPQGSRGRAEHCRYQLPTWRPRRSARSEGLSALAPAPFWAPTPTLEPELERLGRRREHYELLLAAADGRSWQCPLPQARWARYRQGQSLRLQVDRFGVANCASLPY